MTAGQDFVKKLRPFGCVLFIGMSVLFLILCFTSVGKAPLPDYYAPHTAEYYETHLDELCTELTEHMLPMLGCDADFAVTGEKITVTAAPDELEAVKGAVVHYYTDRLFIFETDTTGDAK